MNPKISYTKPSITDLEVRYATDAARNGWGERCYEYIARFEKEFCKFLGIKHAIATSSCTGALHLGLAALGIGPGDEVILADANWIASVAPITYLGATPVLVDILPDTWCIDPVHVEQAITPKTKAIIAVHLYGNLCEMDALLEIGRRYGIAVIEDAAEAIGSTFDQKNAGSMGRFGTFSFHGTKTMTTGEGGMFVTNDDQLFETVFTLSNHGRARGQTKQFWPDKIGFKYKMSNIEAAIGCAQLERVDELVAEKLRIYETYKRLLSSANVRLNPASDELTSPGYWMVNAVFDQNCMDVHKRDKLIATLAAINADARVFFWPLTQTGHFERRHLTPISYDISARSLNLPSAFGITEPMCETVCDIVRQYSQPLQEVTNA